jgi:hypothetical protein
MTRGCRVDNPRNTPGTRVLHAIQRLKNEFVQRTLLSAIQRNTHSDITQYSVVSGRIHVAC